MRRPGNLPASGSSRPAVPRRAAASGTTRHVLARRYPLALLWFSWNRPAPDARQPARGAWPKTLSGKSPGSSSGGEILMENSIPSDRGYLPPRIKTGAARRGQIAVTPRNKLELRCHSRNTADTDPRGSPCDGPAWRAPGGTSLFLRDSPDPGRKFTPQSAYLNPRRGEEVETEVHNCGQPVPWSGPRFAASALEPLCNPLKLNGKAACPRRGTQFAPKPSRGCEYASSPAGRSKLRPTCSPESGNVID